MPQIHELSPHVADLIAAGEVVERPASVIKELLENAIDAGSSAVTVEIAGGGMMLMRVSDNGCGISSGDVPLAFRPHATSKIREEHDLEAIGTLGFRGEALAAISSVSRVELITKTPEEPQGTAFTMEGGAAAPPEEIGCPNGTTMVVRDLFYNTPARLKFMKRDVAEGAAVFAVVQRCALSHPEVAIRFLRDGKQEMSTPGDGDLKSAVYSVLGREFALGFLPIKGSGEDITVSGFSSMPTCCRGTRGYQHFFVNGRYVKSRTMQAAVEEAYRNQKMVGKFPGCVLHLGTKLSAVDVNVHPAKTEVKFVSDKRVFDAIYYAVFSALGGDRSRPAATLTPPAPVPPPAVHHPAMGTMTLRDVIQKANDSRILYANPAQPVVAAQKMAASPPRTPPSVVPPSAQRENPRPAAGNGVRTGAPPVAAGMADPISPAVSAEPAPKQPPAPAPEKVPPVRAEGEPPAPWRMVGEVLNTYIIVEQGDDVLFLDKHAAHERMEFDKLKAADYRPMAQQLLAPVVFTPTPEEGAALLQSLPLLEHFGFSVEDFGGGALLVREAPGDVPAALVEATLTELAATLLATGGLDPAAQRDHLLHTIACKAAIKGGQKNAPEELLRVASAVLEGDVRFCPHGRPVAITLTRAQLEKQFKRS